MKFQNIYDIVSSGKITLLPESLGCTGGGLPSDFGGLLRVEEGQGLGPADRCHAAKGGGPVGSNNPTASEVAAS
jgi:hypothetical protein